MAEKNLVSVESENLRLGEAALNLNGQHRFLHFAMEGTVGREEEVARQLHSQGGGTLNLAARLDVPIGGAHDAPEIDARVAIEIFVFNRDDRVAQDRRKIVVPGNHTALQGERA